MVLDESVDELYDSLTELPPEGAGQGKESRGHSVHVNIVVILGIIARNMPMCQRDRNNIANMAKKIVALMSYIIYNMTHIA